MVDQNLTGNGINMCYGRHTGYGGYGDALRGGRQIFLDQNSMDNEIETWIRLEDGTVSGAVTLNATYGQDRYDKGTARMMRATSDASLYSQSAMLPLVFLWIFTVTFLHLKKF